MNIKADRGACPRPGQLATSTIPRIPLDATGDKRLTARRRRLERYLLIPAAQHVDQAS